MPGEFCGLSCPKCRADLLLQGDVIWCSYLPCDYGLHERKTLKNLVDGLRQRVRELEAGIQQIGVLANEVKIKIESRQ